MMKHYALLKSPTTICDDPFFLHNNDMFENQRLEWTFIIPDSGLTGISDYKFKNLE